MQIQGSYQFLTIWTAVYLQNIDLITFYHAYEFHSMWEHLKACSDSLEEIERIILIF